MLQSSLDFTDYIAEHTKDFTGRTWVFQKIDQWLADPSAPRYFIITGEPGIGKTAIAAQLTKIRDLAALHFCIARQADTINPLAFIRCILQQLIRIQGFSNSILKHNENYFRADQDIQENYGQVIGVNIETLENLTVNTPSAVEAFTQTIIEPLKRLYGEGFEQQLVFLIDSLDEAIQHSGQTTIVELLANAGGLPPQVRFVLTSRPEKMVLRHFESHPYLIIDAGGEKNTQDVQTFIRSQLETFEQLRTWVSEHEMTLQKFIELLTDASEGNFLYLVWVLRAIIKKTQQFDLSALPKGLDGIYREFLRVRKLGKELGEEWHRVYLHFLGVLSVAQAPLTSEQLLQFTGLTEQELSKILLKSEIQQFLDPTEIAQGQYQFFHQSVTDFFGDKEKAEEFWIDLMSIHKQIIAYYLGEADDWESLIWGQVDDYGLIHLAKHLYQVRSLEKYSENLYGLICKPFMQEKRRRYGSHQSFAADVDLVIEAASLETPPDFVQLIRGCLIYATLVSLSASVPPEAIEVLARGGQIAEAMGVTALIQDQSQRYKLYLLLAESLLELNKPDGARKALNQAKEIAPEYDRQRIRILFAEASLRKGNLEQALEILPELEDEYQQTEVLERFAKTLVQSRKYEQAFAVIDKIEVQYQRISAIVQAVHVLINMNGLTEAIVWIKKLCQEQEEGSVFEKIVEILVKEERLEDALVMIEMIELDDTFKASALSKAAKVLVEKQKFQQVLSLAQKILGDGWRKDDIISQVVQSLAQDQRLDEALALASTVTGDYRRAETFSEILQDIKARSGVKQTLLVADMIPGELNKAEALSRMAHTLTKSGHLDEALIIIDGIQEKSKPLCKLVPLIAHTGEYDKILTAAEKIPNDREREDVFSEVAKCIASTGKVEEVFAITKRIHDQAIQDSSLSGAVQTLSQTGNFDEALAIVERITSENIQECAKLKIAEDMARAEMPEQALSLANEVKKDTEKVGILCEIALAFLQTENFSKAAETALQALIAWEFLDDEWKKKYAVPELVRTLAQVKKIEQAFEVAELAGANTTKAKALSWTILPLLQDDQKTKALEVLEQIIELLNVDSNEYWKSDILIRIVNSLASFGLFDEAFDVIKLLTNRHEQTRMFTVILTSMVLAGKSEQSIAIAETIETKTQKQEALGEIAQALVQTGRIQEAFVVINTITEQHIRRSILEKVCQTLNRLEEWDHILSINHSLERRKDRIFIQDKAAQALAELDNGNRALQIATQIESRDKRIKTFGRVLYVITLRSVDTMLQLIKNITDSAIVNQALMKAANNLAFNGECELALELARHVTENKVFDQIMGAVVECLSKSANFERAWAIAERIKDRYKRERSFSHVLLSMLEQYNLNVVLNTVTEKCSEQDYTQILPWTIRDLAREQKFDKALLLAKRIGTQQIKNHGLTEVAKAFAQQGDYNRALEIAEKITDKRVKDDTMHRLVEILADTGQIERAFAITKKMTDEFWYRQDALSKIAIAQAKTQKGNNALDTAQKISNEPKRRDTLAAIAQCLARSGDIERAAELVSEMFTMAGIIEDKRSKKEDMLKTLVDVLINYHKLDYAESVAVAMGEKYWYRARSLSQVADKLFASGDLVQARKVADLAAMAPQGIVDNRNKAWMFGWVSPMILEIKGIRGFKKLLKMVDRFENPFRVIVLSRIALALSGSEWRTRSSKPHKIHALTKFIEFSSRVRWKSIAVHVTRIVLKDLKLLEFSDEKAVVLSRIAQAFSHLNRKPAKDLAYQALSLVEAMKDRWKKTEALDRIAWVLLQSQDKSEITQAVNHVLQVISTIQEQYDTQSVLATLACGLAQINEQEELNQVLSVIEDIDNIEIKADIFQKITETLVKFKQQSKAQEIANQALNMLENSDDKHIERLIDKVVVSLIRAGEQEKVSRAIALIQEIEDRQQKAQALSKTAWSLWKANVLKAEIMDLTEQVLMLGKTLEYPQHRAEILGQAAQIFAEAGKQEQAHKIFTEAFMAARLAGRDTVFETFKHAIPAFPAMNQGKIIWSAYNAMQEVDAWWNG